MPASGYDAPAEPWAGSSHPCHPQCVTGPSSAVFHEPSQTTAVCSSRDGDAPGVRSCCAACCWLLYLCHCCRGWDVTPGRQCRGYLGPFLTVTRCLLFLTGFYFLVVFPSGFGFSLHGWAWWPYLTAMVSVLLLSCCCDTVELGRPGDSKPGPGHQCGVRDVSVTACSPTYVRPLQYPLSFSFLLPLLLNVSHPLCVKTAWGECVTVHW